jgi:hypothetical protein
MTDQAPSADVERGRHKILFIHVPKTAGTTINLMLEQSGKPGVAHCENKLTRATRDDFYRQYDWISGHVSITRVQNVLEDRLALWTLYAALRTPADQVRSHLNGQIEVYHRGYDFFYSHPTVNQKIIIDFMRSDLRSRFDLMYLMLQYSGLFLNCQSRFLAPELVEEPTAQKARAALDRFAFVGSSANIDETVRRLLPDRPTDALPHENRGRQWIDRGVFAHPDITNFLARHNRADEILYNEAGEKFGWSTPAQGQG